MLLRCQRILKALDPAALPRLAVVSSHHLATRTATLDAATQALFWQVPGHEELRRG
jgi:hypothetical protein